MNKCKIWGLLLTGIFLSACSGQQNETDFDAYREIIESPGAPEAVGPYSQAVRVGNTLFLAGQVGLDPDTGQLAGESLETQTLQALDNISAILDEAGYSKKDVVDVQVFLTDIADYPVFNELYGTWFQTHKPARTLVEVSSLPVGAKVEIKMMAVKQP